MHIWTVLGWLTLSPSVEFSDPPAFIQFYVYFKLFSTALALVSMSDYFSPTNASPFTPVMRAYAQITNIFIP